MMRSRGGKGRDGACVQSQITRQAEMASGGSGCELRRECCIRQWRPATATHTLSNAPGHNEEMQGAFEDKITRLKGILLVV